MKTKIHLILAGIILATNTIAQTPGLINYQATVRNTDGTISANKKVGIRFTIREGNPDGNATYEESHTLETNEFGLISTQIGSGTPTAGDITTIDWGSNSYYLQVEVDPNGGENYQTLSTENAQLVAVPYALHAKTVENEGQVLNKIGDTLFISDGNFVVLDGVVNTDDQNIDSLFLNGTTLSIDIEGGAGKSVDLASLQDGTGTDDQNITGSGLSGTDLTIGIENGTSQIIDLSTLQDGTGTDDQKLTLSNDTLYIEDGNKVFIGGNTDTLPIIKDADNDTKVEVDQNNSNDDIIHFTMGGTEYFTMESGRIETANTGNSVFIGNNAGQNDDFSANENVAIGDDALSTNVNGNRNVAVGGFALHNYTLENSVAVGYEALRMNTGTNNTAVGTYSLLDNTTGSSNTSLGLVTLRMNTTGSENTAIGRTALHDNTSGSKNVAVGVSASENSNGSNNVHVGYYAGKGATGSRNIFIGNQAGENESGSDKLYIHNSNSNNPLIWGDFANGSVKINGTLNINNAFSFPNTDGSNGQILQTDGSGDVTWVTPINAIQTVIRDGDGDTEVQTEKSVDEDKIRFNVAGNQAMIIDKNGRVGIGTNNPITDLHFEQDTLLLKTQKTFSGTYLQIQGHRHNPDTQIGTLEFLNIDQSDGNILYTAANIESTNDGGSNDGDLRFSISNDLLLTEAMRIDSDGNVGIGTTTPSDELHVAGKIRMVDGNQADGLFLKSDANGTGNWHNVDEIKDFDGNTNIQVEETTNENKIRFDIDGSEAMIIDDNRNIGIGTSTPSEFVHIRNSANHAILKIEAPSSSHEARLEFSKFSGNFSAAVGYYPGNADLRIRTESNNGIRFETNNLEVMRINNNGRVGINRIATTNILEIEGNASKSSAGDWLANSDARLKKNITQLNSEQMLNSLLSLQGVTYEWNDNKTGNERPEGIQYGFTAQNIQQVFPTLVTEDAKGYLQTPYGTYDAMTVEAIRALNNKIQALEKENAKLKKEVKEIDALKADIEEIKKDLLESSATVKN